MKKKVFKGFVILTIIKTLKNINIYFVLIGRKLIEFFMVICD